jgi:hypothetical protein
MYQKALDSSADEVVFDLDLHVVDRAYSNVG